MEQINKSDFMPDFENNMNKEYQTNFSLKNFFLFGKCKLWGMSKN